MAEREGTTAPLNLPVSLLRIAMKMYGFQNMCLENNLFKNQNVKNSWYDTNNAITPFKPPKSCNSACFRILKISKNKRFFMPTSQSACQQGLT